MQLPRITNKQQEILTLFLKFRFLSRQHVQKFLNHKDEKTIQTWLMDLVQKDYLEKRKENIKQFPPKPTVYLLGKNSIKFLKDQEILPTNFLTNLYRDDERSHSFICRCFLIVNICLELQQSSTDKETFRYFTKSDYIQSDSEFNFLTELRPPLCFTKKIKGRKINWFLLEVFSSTHSNQEIRRRIHTYVRFLVEEEWVDTLGTNPPAILFMCSSKQMLSYARQYTKRKLRRYIVEGYDMSFALEEEVKKEGIRGDIWSEIV